MRGSRSWQLALTGAALAIGLITCTESGRQPVGPIRAVIGGSIEHDIRTTGATINGAVWNLPQNYKVGTGVLKTFLQVQQKGNNTTEQGFNTNALPVYDDGSSATFNHSLELNHIPVVEFSGSFFREFVLDANEANADPAANFSIDLFDLWLCKQTATSDPRTFTTFANFDETGTNTNCARVYSLGPDDIALATDANSKGSGSSFDYQILIPEDKFETAASGVGADISQCAYAGTSAPSCGVWIVLKVQLGFEGGDFVVGSTFEEFSIVSRPFVVVTKTATPTFTRRYNWTIAKTVSPSDLALFEGQSADATWTITVSADDPPFTDSDPQVSGTITIANPSGSAVTINSVADEIPGYPTITPTCPGTSFPTPYVLANNQSLVCTYSVAAPNTNAGTHTNTATVEIVAKLTDTDLITAAVFTGSKDFDFANATATEIDKDPPVFDNYDGGGEQPVGNASGSPIVTTRTYACNDDERQFSNTARVDLTDPATDPTASATLTVDCLTLTVEKTATTSIQREYLWLIAKSVTPAAWELFRGDEGTSAYTVTVTPNGHEDDTWTVSGVITITGDPNAPVYLQSVSDAITGGFNPTPTSCQDGATPVDLGTDLPYTLAAGHSLVCAYSQVLTDATGRTNTATAVAKPTPSGTDKSFTGSKDFDFATATLDEVNKTVHVDDSYTGTGSPQDAPVTDLVNPTVFNYDRSFACDDDAGPHDNTATITETGQSDDASVTVTCRSVTVVKDAATSFNRDWDWTIEKTADQTGPLLLAPGQTFQVNYKIAVARTGPTDSDWHVTGTITVTHNHLTRGALLESVSDAVSGIVDPASITACQVAGSPVAFPFTLGVGETLTCTYDSDLPNTDQRTNTATVTQRNHHYSSANPSVESDAGTTDASSTPVDVVFGTPTNETDECATVGDSYSGGPQAEATCDSKDYTYTRDIVAPDASCIDFTVDNTATLTPNDHAIAQTDDWSVAVDVQCPEGCTLTLGYWRTHNATFPGGAPLDATWDLLPLAELSGFFTNTGAPPSYPVVGPNDPPFTWYSVFWTAPKGNAYYNLSQQYMAAKLNILNGADPTAASAAIATAEGLFSTYTPAAINSLKGSFSLRQQFISLAGTLGSYNEGNIGPGHCSEDGTSALQSTR